MVKRKETKRTSECIRNTQLLLFSGKEGVTLTLSPRLVDEHLERFVRDCSDESDNIFHDVCDQHRKRVACRLEEEECSTRRILYVGQREIAHVAVPDLSYASENHNSNGFTSPPSALMPLDCDVLVTDRATTCHILFLRSTAALNDRARIRNSTSYPQAALCTAAHLDSPKYDDCIRKAVQYHCKYHRHKQEQKGSGSANLIISMDVHVGGGFLDENDASRSLTDWLLHLLADIADEYSTTNSNTIDCPLVMTVRTLIVSCMNNQKEAGSDVHQIDTNVASANANTTTNSNKYEKKRSCPSNSVDCSNANGKDTNENNKTSLNYPIVRGLAMNCITGMIYPAYCYSHKLMGPAISLRHARLWSGQSTLLLLTDPTTAISTKFTIPETVKSSHIMSEVSESKQFTGTHDTGEVARDMCLHNTDIPAASALVVTIEPFAYHADQHLLSLLRLDNEQLLCIASTSPHCEGDDFCDLIRNTIRFMQTSPSHQVFRDRSEYDKDKRRTKGSESLPLQRLEFVRSVNIMSFGDKCQEENEFLISYSANTDDIIDDYVNVNDESNCSNLNHWKLLQRHHNRNESNEHDAKQNVKHRLLNLIRRR